MSKRRVVMTAESEQYPLTLLTSERNAPALTVMGDLATLRNPLLALVCSVRCPGRAILGTYDLAVALREEGVPVIGGFHSPMERECLRLLLRGTQPVIIAMARSISTMRVPNEWREPVASGRLLIISAEPDHARRVSAETAQARNRLVATLARMVFVPYAALDGKTEALCRDLIAQGKPLLTLDDPHNAGLVALGAREVRPDSVREWWA